MQLWVVSQPENQQPCGHLLFDPFHSEVSEWSSIDFKKRERERKKWKKKNPEWAPFLSMPRG